MYFKESFLPQALIHVEFFNVGYLITRCSMQVLFRAPQNGTFFAAKVTTWTSYPLKYQFL